MKLLPLPSLFKPKVWPLCTQQPKTSSFRIATMKEDIYKTINSMYFDLEGDSVETPDSWFTNSSESLLGSTSTSGEYDDSSMSISGESQLEEIVRSAQTSNHRLFFDPKESSDSPKIQTSDGDEHETLTLGRASICVENKRGPFQKSVAMSLESEDPYEDFKRSMEEMVECLGVKDDWEGLEELLRWYLKVNGREIHGYIINAFVDLLGGVISRKSISISNSNSLDDRDISKSTTSFSSAVSFISCTASSSDHFIS